jgi:nucleotide-binding universal stress UspA family protein
VASHAVVDLAVRLACPGGSTVTLVHALGRESPIKSGRRRLQEPTLEEPERTLRSGTSEVVVEHGRPADVIKSAAAAADASLVVMPSRNLDGLRAMGRREQASHAQGELLRAPLPALGATCQSPTAAPLLGLKASPAVRGVSASRRGPLG